MENENNPLVTAFHYLVSLSDDELKTANDVWMRGNGNVLVVAAEHFLIMCNPDAGNALLDTIRIQSLSQEELDPRPALVDILQNHGEFFASVLPRLKEIKEVLLDNGSVRFRQDSFY